MINGSKHYYYDTAGLLESVNNEIAHYSAGLGFGERAEDKMKICASGRGGPAPENDGDVRPHGMMMEEEETCISFFIFLSREATTPLEHGGMMAATETRFFFLFCFFGEEDEELRGARAGWLKVWGDEEMQLRVHLRVSERTTGPVYPPRKEQVTSKQANADGGVEAARSSFSPAPPAGSRPHGVRVKHAKTSTRLSYLGADCGLVSSAAVAHRAHTASPRRGGGRPVGGAAERAGEQRGATVLKCILSVR